MFNKDQILKWSYCYIHEYWWNHEHFEKKYLKIKEIYLQLNMQIRSLNFVFATQG